MADVKEVQDVTDQTFEQDVLQADVPVLVDFWAPWCGPCRMVAPVVKELAGEYEGKVNFRKLNTDENPTVAAKFNIRSIPTLLLFKNGEQVGQIVGARPKNHIKERIDAALV
jgi:thioredoxin 1